MLSPGRARGAGRGGAGLGAAGRRTVGRGAVVRRAILDKNVVVPPGAHIGVDLARDRGALPRRDGGIVVLGKGHTAVT